MADSIERGWTIVAMPAFCRQTCERSWRVISSIAERPRWTASTRAAISPERLIVTSTSEKVASEMTIAIVSVTRSSGSVMPSSRRARASITASTSRSCCHVPSA